MRADSLSSELAFDYEEDQKSFAAGKKAVPVPRVPRNRQASMTTTEVIERMRARPQHAVVSL